MLSALAEHGLRPGVRNEKLPVTLDMHDQGFSNKAIASALGVSAPTIANWLKRGRT